MKKIGILFGKERSFPEALVDRINKKNIDNVVAESVQIDKVMQAVNNGYSVIIDRISQDVPFYRAMLKNAAISGTAVINNPFWWSADEKFFNNALAENIGVPVPKTVLLPSKEHPEDTSSESFTNLVFPLDWEGIFEYIGFPAYMKPHAGGGWKNVYRLVDQADFFDKYAETNQLVMMLQEEIIFESYFRCYCIGGKYVRIMHYEPRNPHHLRYVANHDVSEEMLALMESYVLKINHALGYDFNTVELAIREGVPYAIDFCNPAPDAAVDSVGEENFEWVVETMANYAIERAIEQDENKMNLTWGNFVKSSVSLPLENDNQQTETTTPAPASNSNPITIDRLPSNSLEPQAIQTITLSGGAADRVKKDLLSLIGPGDPVNMDDLQRINGIGPKLEEILHDLGINSFAQLSRIGKVEADLLDSLLTAFKGHSRKDDWAGQAMAILAGLSYNSLLEEE